MATHTTNSAQPTSLTPEQIDAYYKSQSGQATPLAPLDWLNSQTSALSSAVTPSATATPTSGTSYTVNNPAVSNAASGAVPAQSYSFATPQDKEVFLPGDSSGKFTNTGNIYVRSGNQTYALNLEDLGKSLWSKETASPTAIGNVLGKRENVEYMNEPPSERQRLGLEFLRKQGINIDYDNLKGYNIGDLGTAFGQMQGLTDYSMLKGTQNPAYAAQQNALSSVVTPPTSGTPALTTSSTPSPYAPIPFPTMPPPTPLQAQTGALSSPTSSGGDWLQKLYDLVIGQSTPSTSESATQAQLDALFAQQAGITASRDLGIQGVGEQPIAMPFISGQQTALTNRAAVQSGALGAQAVPLQQQLAREQAKRQAALDVAKFGVEYGFRKEEMDTQKSQYAQEFAFKQQQFNEDTRRFGIDYALKQWQLQTGQQQDAQELAFRKQQFDEDSKRFGLDYALKQQQIQNEQQQTSTANAFAQQKFEEDKRQFGLQYALEQQKLNQPKPLSQAQEAAQIAASEKQVAAQQQTSQTLQVVNDLLSGNIKGIFGVGQNPLNYLGLTNAKEINQYTQLKAQLALGARSLLKGSGAVSDYESRILNASTSALGRNLNNEEGEAALKTIRGVLLTNSGQEVLVIVRNPQGQVIGQGTLNGQDIYEAASDGNTIEYL